MPSSSPRLRSHQCPGDDWAGRGHSIQSHRGFLFASLEVAISTATPEAEIYYTTDGSRPLPNHGSRYGAHPDPDHHHPSRRNLPGELQALRHRHPDLPVSGSGAEPDRRGFPKFWGSRNDVPVVADYEMDRNCRRHPLPTSTRREPGRGCQRCPSSSTGRISLLQRRESIQIPWRPDPPGNAPPPLNGSPADGTDEFHARCESDPKAAGAAALRRAPSIPSAWNFASGMARPTSINPCLARPVLRA